MEDAEKTRAQLLDEIATLRQRVTVFQEELHRTTRALRENEANMRALFDAVDEALVFADPHTGQLLALNTTAAMRQGKRPEELVGRSFREVVPEEFCRFIEEEIAYILATKQPFHGSVVAAGRYIEERVHPIFDDAGNVARVAIYGRNVTAWKQREEALRRAERLISVGTLASGMAHELNNPIGAILMVAQDALALLQPSTDTTPVVEALGHISQEAQRCGRIIRSMLQFARNEPSDKWPYAMKDVVERAKELLRLEAVHPGVTIDLDLHNDLPLVVLNPTEMEQALVNLLQNAIAADSTYIVVQTAFTLRNVQVIVRDNGKGMTDEQQLYAFEPFYTTRQVQGGTGLGLSLARSIVTEHQGTIQCVSHPDEGTTFTIELPRYAPA